jgi:hypothetical protein
MIDRYGNPTPFLDQWDAEAANLYPRFLNGTLHLSDLTAAHNEHRILVTRLWSLLLLELNGFWDPILQMVANTLILGAFVALFISVFRPVLTERSWLGFALFSMVIFALPIGYENTLWGFNSSWYFLPLVSIAGIFVVTSANAFSPFWWLAFLLISLSYFCMASGALTVAAAFAICFVQFSARIRRGALEVGALGLLAVYAVILVRDVPVVAGHAMKAHSIFELARSAIQIASWPVAHPVPTILRLPCAILINAPAALATIHVIRLRPLLNDRRWFLVALSIWVALQCAAIAYGRASAPNASRYLDLYVIAILLNGACLSYLVQTYRETWLRDKRGTIACAVWLLLIASASTIAGWQSIHSVSNFAKAGQAETENLRTFLMTNDRHALENLYIPYPDPQRLAAITSDTVVRAILPPALVGEASAARAQEHDLARFTGRIVQTIKEFMLRWGALLVPIGVIIFLLSLVVKIKTPEEKTTASSANWL